jgi:hypothetical protein
MLTAIAPMARKHSAAAIRTLVHIAQNGTPDSARVSAACALLDRGFGRPAQSVELDMVIHKQLDAMNLEELRAFREKYAMLTLSAPLVMDHSTEREEAQPEDVPIEADNEQRDA